MVVTPVAGRVEQATVPVVEAAELAAEHVPTARRVAMAPGVVEGPSVPVDSRLAPSLAISGRPERATPAVVEITVAEAEAAVAAVAAPAITAAFRLTAAMAGAAPEAVAAVVVVPEPVDSAAAPAGARLDSI